MEAVGKQKCRIDVFSKSRRIGRFDSFMDTARDVSCQPSEEILHVAIQEQEGSRVKVPSFRCKFGVDCDSTYPLVASTRQAFLSVNIG